MVIGIAEDLQEARDVSGLTFTFFAAFGAHFHLQLHIDGVGRDLGKVAIRIFGVEVTAVPVNACPGALGGFDHVNEVVRLCDDAPMIFEAKEDAFFGGVV